MFTAAAHSSVSFSVLWTLRDLQVDESFISLLEVFATRKGLHISDTTLFFSDNHSLAIVLCVHLVLTQSNGFLSTQCSSYASDEA